MGGTYNEPNTNLTGPETTIRNLVYGIGYQRDIMGADPQTAWQLDVFGHDPQFPGLVADAGLTSTLVGARAVPPVGPDAVKFDGASGDAKNMQFPAEFEWISPSGHGRAHPLHAQPLLGRLVDGLLGRRWRRPRTSVYDLFLALKPAAATRNTLLPVGTDYTPPNKLGHRDPPRLERALRLAALRLRPAA